MSIQSCSKKDDNPVGGDGGATIGVLTATPEALVVNNVTYVTVRLTVPSGVKLADSTAEIYRVTGGSSVLLGLVYDDGEKSHSDDIKNDNVYNNRFAITEATAGTVDLQARATTNAGFAASSGTATLTVYSNLTTNEYQTIIKTQDSAATKLNQYLNGNPANAATAVTQLKAWLRSKADVQSVDSSGSTSISILYKSGIYGGVFISQANVSGTVLTRGGIAPQTRRSARRLPVSRQTVGTTVQHSPGLAKTFDLSDLDPKIIGNRNVLIYAPFESAFTPYNEGASVQSILNNSGFKFDITYYSNQAATVAALSDMTGYGYVVLATHGSAGREFATGELVDTNATVYTNSYKALIKAGKLAIWQNMVISSTGGVTKKGNFYVIRYPFISSLSGTFPNSVILNNSCESTMNPDLENAFIGKGAKAYYGYTKVVNSGFCVTNADTLTKRLAKDLKTTGQAFMAGTDPGTPNAVYELKGANDVHYPDSLINGDFEFGKIDGWTRTGDGRVISYLGSQSPTGGSYMGIISTGLGFTEQTGAIFQTFTIKTGQTTLNLKWNFLSEEFLEYIGARYQDYFQVVIRDANGAESVLLNKTIDGLASEFGATDSTAGDLIKVSPGIMFDVGDVYMTGWQTATLNVSAYAGKRITLIIRAGDVGDSIYDTAILVDDVTVQ